MIAILILTFTIITLSAKFLLSIINKQKEINKVKLKDTWTKIIDQTLNNPNINAKQNERLKIDNFKCKTYLDNKVIVNKIKDISNLDCALI